MPPWAPLRTPPWSATLSATRPPMECPTRPMVRPPRRAAIRSSAQRASRSGDCHSPFHPRTAYRRLATAMRPPPDRSTLRDARWALDRIAARLGGLPIGLVGHSMGGRVALRVADHGGVLKGAHGGIHSWGVRSVAALAPWLPDGEPIPVLGERALLLAHGTADRTTDPAKTTELAAKLAAGGGDVELVKYPGARHAMLFPARPWHDMVASFMVRTLLVPAPEGSSGPARH